MEESILAGGVDTQFIQWLPYDGAGRLVRNGLNFSAAPESAAPSPSPTAATAPPSRRMATC